MKKHLFVINPVSGGAQKDMLIAEIEKLFHKYSIRIIKTTGLEDAERLKKEIQDFNPDIVNIGGGDGTINKLALTISNAGKTMGIIPSGSANGLATDLGIDINNALDCIKSTKTIDLDIVMINNHPMIHMADLGLNAALIRRYEQEERRGLLGYAVSAFKELSAVNDLFEALVTTDNTTLRLLTSFLVIANSKQYGTGYEINPNGQLDDQQFEICAMKELSVDNVFQNLFNPENAGRTNGIFDSHSYTEAAIKLQKATDFQIDGEYMGKVNELSIKVHSNQIKLLIP